MLEARRRHRQLRAKQRRAVAPRHGLEHRRPAAARRPASAPEFARHVAKALKFFAFVVLSQLGYRLASWVVLPVPGSVVAVGILLSLLSGRFMPTRWAQRLAAMLLKHLPVCMILVAVALLALDDPLTARGLAIALTLLVGAIAGLVATRRTPWFHRRARMRVLASPARGAHSQAGPIQTKLVPTRLSPSFS